MWPALTVSGVMVLFFGFFLMIIMGVLGLVIFLSGPLMIAAGLLLKTPNPSSPDDHTKRFCNFCMAEVDNESLSCPECGFTE
jgi:hypothetical protein